MKTKTYAIKQNGTTTQYRSSKILCTLYVTDIEGKGVGTHRYNSLNFIVNTAELR